MAKKLLVVWLLIPIIVLSSISIYANQEEPAAQVFQNSRTQEEPAEVVTAAAVKETAVRKEDKGYLQGLSAYIRHINQNVSKQEADDMVRHFVESADKYNVDEKVVMAIAQNESTYYADAVSCEDYKGLMQTGDGLAENAGYAPDQLFEPSVSIQVGARYLRIKMDEFGDLRLALTAYNQGSGSVHAGTYTTGYADLAIERAAAMEDFLIRNGYIEKAIS